MVCVYASNDDNILQLLYSVYSIVLVLSIYKIVS